MSRPYLKAVVAMASNRVIGKDGGLPWRLKEDLKWFKKMTVGHPILMGRKTMDSIVHPLPKRRNIVISRNLETVPEGFELAASCPQALDMLGEDTEASIIGGAQIYREMIPLCDEVLLSYVFHPYDGDTTLPEFESSFVMVEVLFRDDDFELRRYLRLSVET
ncbi:MAG: dihydrofolate reductase [Verrucomicrobiales bacterium]|jgi:dihydrofolate reductase|nr:dihydrofolate reductase [Verrucomicrobiales bacterium]HQZ28946.1 dihydrofolate reductase [Verrucomicrobiales bacterium]